MNCNLDHKSVGTKHCPECGEKLVFSEEEIAKALCEREIYLAKDRCPFARRWNGWESTSWLTEAWAMWEVLGKEGFFNLAFSWAEALAVKRKKNGVWTGKFEDYSRFEDMEKNYNLFQPHPGNPFVMAVKEGERFSEQFYESRQIGRMLFDRFSKRRYVTEELADRIRLRLDVKYGRCRGRYHAERNNRRFADVARGPFTPVDINTAAPAIPINCCVCGDLVGAGYYAPAEDDFIELHENWSNHLSELGWSGKMEAVICDKPLCAEVIGWQDKDTDIASAAREIDVPLSVPTRKTIESYPEEYRGVFLISKYVEFQSRYTAKMQQING